MLELIALDVVIVSKVPGDHTKRLSEVANEILVCNTKKMAIIQIVNIFLKLNINKISSFKAFIKYMP